MYKYQSILNGQEKGWETVKERQLGNDSKNDHLILHT